MYAVFLLPVCLTYWPKSIPASTPTSTIPTKFEVDMIIHCWFQVVCLTIRYVTLWPCRFTFWPWTVTHGGSRDQPCHQVWNQPFLSYPSKRLSLDNVSGYCACAVSRDLCVDGKFTHIFGIHKPRFAYSLCNFGRSTMKIVKVICENNARPCAKSRQLLKVP